MKVLPIEKRLFALGERYLDAANADVRNLALAFFVHNQGERAVERLLTIVRTCQLQQLNALVYLTAAIAAHCRRQAVASCCDNRRPPVTTKQLEHHAITVEIRGTLSSAGRSH